MIAIWMLYGWASGALLALVGWLLQRGLQRLLLPTRWAWAGVIIGSVLLFAAAPVVEHEMREPPASRGSGSAMSVARSAKDGHGAVVPRASVTSLASTVAVLDRPLAGAWTLASLLLVVAILRRTRLAVATHDVDVDGVPVLVTDHVGPAAFGVRHPTILLPRWVLELEPDLRSLVLRHEQEHVSARDPALLVAAMMAVVLVPWQPTLWWSLRRLRFAIELDCDARVLRTHPDVRRYGELLLLVGQHTTGRVRQRLLPNAALATLLPNGSTLKLRIMAMTQSRSLRSPVAAALLILAAGAVTLIACDLPTPPVRLSPPNPAASPLREGATLTTMTGATGDIAVSFTVSSVTGRPVLVRLLRSDSTDFVISAPQAFVADDMAIMKTPITGTGHLDRGGLTFVSEDGGEFEVRAHIEGGPAKQLMGRGHHMTLDRGGAGVSGLW